MRVVYVEVVLSQVVFSSWGREVVDNRQGGDADLASINLKLPENYLDQGKVSAFMGWDGIVLLDKETDVVAMAAEYMKRVQEKHCCAKCTPGKRGKVGSGLGPADAGAEIAIGEREMARRKTRTTTLPSLSIRPPAERRPIGPGLVPLVPRLRSLIRNPHSLIRTYSGSRIASPFRPNPRIYRRIRRGIGTVKSGCCLQPIIEEAGREERTGTKGKLRVAADPPSRSRNGNGP